MATAALLGARLGLLPPRRLGTPRRLHNRVPQHQRLFQEDNGLPVHLKGGALDTVLYRFTTLVCVGGTCYSLLSLARASMPHRS